MPTPPSDSPSPPPRATPLWRNLSFTLMWTSTAASGFGDRMMMLAALTLLGATAANADATGTQAATQFWFFLPYILFSVPAGWLADRLPRKWLMLACDESRGVILLLAFAALASASGVATLPLSHQWKVSAALFAVGTFAAIFNPARNAIVPQIIERPQLPAANAIILGINVVASMIGMVVGGRLFDPDHATSVRTGLFTGAMFYIVSGTFFAFLRPVQTAHVRSEPRNRSLTQALRYIVTHRSIAILIGLNVLVWASAAAVSSAVLGLLKAHYAMEGKALLEHFTQVSAMIGVGMLVGALVVAVLSIRRELTSVLMGSLIAAGLAVVALVSVPWLPMTYAAALGLGVAGNIAIVAVITLLQSLSPNYVRGRIMGISAMIDTICSVGTYFAIMRIPNADRGIIVVLWALGPGLMLVGVVGLARFLVRGPMPTRFLNVLWHIERLFVLVWHRLKWSGRHNIPATGPVILAANHTTGLDPFLMQAACRRLIKWVMLESYRYRVLEPVWRALDPIALNQNGGDLENIRTIIRSLKSGQIVGLFPEGALQRESRELKPFAPGIGMIAQRSGATIVPVWIDGTPRTHSMFWHFVQPSRSTVIFGTPYKPDPEAEHEAVAEDLRERMIALSRQCQKR